MTLLESINAVIPEPIKAKIKELQVKFSAEPVVPAPVVPVVAPANLAAIETKLKDGTTLSVDKMEVGGTATIISESGSTPAPDGEYESEDGTKITVASGLISAIVPVAAPAAPAPDNGMPALMARLDALENKFTAAVAENLSLKTNLASVQSELAGNKEAITVTLSAVNSILSIPAGDPIEGGKPTKKQSAKKTYEEMNNYERMLFNKGKL